MRIIVHSGKYGDSYFFMKESARGETWLKVFRTVYIEAWEHTSNNYQELFEMFVCGTPEEKILFLNAAAGDERAAYRFIQERDGAEYECFNIHELIE